MTLRLHLISSPLILATAACYNPSLPDMRATDDGAAGTTEGASAELTDTNTDTGSSSGASGLTDPMSGSADASSSGSSDGEGTTTPEEPGCGNGVVEQGEECDDGDDVDGNGCNAGCVLSGAVQWELSLPSEFPRDVQVTAEGDVLTGGRNLGVSGWFTRIAGDGDDEELHVDVDSRVALVADLGGGSVLVGTAEGAGPDAVVRFSSEGEVEWSQELDLIDSWIRDVKVDSVTGQVVAVYSVEQNQSWIRRFTIDGALLWEFSEVSSANRFYPVSLSIDAAGQMLVVSTGNVAGVQASNDRKMTVTRSTPAGVEQWRAEYDAGGTGAYFVGSPTASGDVVVAGRTYLDDQFVGWIRRYDSSGEVLWTIPHAELPNLHFGEVVPVGDDVILVGYEDVAEGEFQGIVRRYSESGELYWEQRPDTEYLIAGDAFDDGSVVVVGSLGDTGKILRLGL